MKLWRRSPKIICELLWTSALAGKWDRLRAVSALCHVFAMDGEVPSAGITASFLSFAHSVLLALIIADKHRHVKQAQLESSPSGAERTQHVSLWF